MTEAPSDRLLAGLNQALQSLFSVARRSRGALTVELDSMRLSKGVLEVRIWLASASLPSSDQGTPLAEWEPIDLQIAADFPLQAPVASSGRDDFPELPHQPQGSRFCVRVPSSDWNPSAGMSGFLRAVISTYGHIALGTLEGKLQPWHPMDHYLGAGCVVVRMDLPVGQIRQDAFLCWAIGIKIHEDRVDIIKWLDLHGNADSIHELTHLLTEELARVRTATPEAFLVPAIVVTQPTTFEYFNNLHQLLSWMERHGNLELADVYSAFFPAAGRMTFRPEPGCSDSTFVGSSTDLSALAAQLLDCGLDRLDLPSASADGEPPQRSLSIVRLGADGQPRAARVVRYGPDDWVVPDNRNLYQIRLSRYATKCIRRHIKASLDEGADAGRGLTGGLLLGEFDDACGIAWVSQATCLPPCSTVEPLDMKLDVRVVRRVLERRSRLSAGMIALVGFWKTQLGGAATMSDEDRQAMRVVVENPKRSPRMLLLLFGLPEDGSVGDPHAAWDPPVHAEAFTA